MVAEPTRRKVLERIRILALLDPMLVLLSLELQTLPRRRYLTSAIGIKGTKITNKFFTIFAKVMKNKSLRKNFQLKQKTILSARPFLIPYVVVVVVVVVVVIVVMVIVVVVLVVVVVVVCGIEVVFSISTNSLGKAISRNTFC